MRFMSLRLGVHRRNQSPFLAQVAVASHTPIRDEIPRMSPWWRGWGRNQVFGARRPATGLAAGRQRQVPPPGASTATGVADSGLAMAHHRP